MHSELPDTSGQIIANCLALLSNEGFAVTGYMMRAKEKRK
jgi:hypothetical protein